MLEPFFCLYFHIYILTVDQTYCIPLVCYAETNTVIAKLLATFTDLRE